jgi:hypothetical protein
MLRRKRTKTLETARSAAVSGSTQETHPRQVSLFWTPLAVIAITAFAVEIPFFFLGTPSGHDVEFHLYSWLEVLGQWKHGTLLPRWASMANFGYGEPRFLFYPPASWTLGGILAAIFPWTIVPSVYIWIALVAAGISMFCVARRWFDRRGAIVAAMIYVANPYHLVTVYWRSAFAELLASCLIPLLLLLVLKAADDGWRALAPLSLLLAAAWLTNIPAAIMIHYSLALLLLLLAWQKRSARVLLVGFAATFIGACLAAFYLLPAIYEQRWIDVAEAVSQGSRPQDNFLFVHTADADHNTFNRIVSWVAVFEMIVIFVTAWAAKTWRNTQLVVWKTLACWAAGCSVLLFSGTALVWRILPKLEFMQFPWRWLLCLSMMFSLFIVAALPRWWIRAAISLLGIAVVVGVWHEIQGPWWDNAGDLREMQDNMEDKIGYAGVEEYTPVGADLSEIDKDARNVTTLGQARAAIRILQWDAEAKSFTADMSASDQLAVKLFDYPAWRVEVNGHVVDVMPNQKTGQMLVPVDSGMNRVEIRFTHTWDRIAGGWISLVSVIGIAVSILMKKASHN